MVLFVSSSLSYFSSLLVKQLVAIFLRYMWPLHSTLISSPIFCLLRQRIARGLASPESRLHIKQKFFRSVASRNWLASFPSYPEYILGLNVAAFILGRPSLHPGIFQQHVWSRVGSNLHCFVRNIIRSRAFLSFIFLDMKNVLKTIYFDCFNQCVQSMLSLLIAADTLFAVFFYSRYFRCLRPFCCRGFLSFCFCFLLSCLNWLNIVRCSFWI